MTCMITKSGDCMIRNIPVKSIRRGAFFIVAGLLAYNVGGLAQSSEQVKWLQSPDTTGWDVNMTTPRLLADDFKCTLTGPITDIHLWTSTHTSPSSIIGNYTFNLSFWSDVPATPDPNSYSQPGQQLWSISLKPSATALIETPPEGWYDPASQVIIANDHVNMVRYDFLIPTPSAFTQQEGTIYWLGVQAIPDPTGDEPLVGWKSSVDHWNDDAVYMSVTGGWQELRDPRSEASMDLAFALTTSSSVPDGGTSILLLGLGLVGLWGAKRFTR
jgi:hypothetical protein